MANDYKKNALIFKAFCDENRLKIIDQIKDNEVCACVLLETLTIGQSTLSHHMKILVESGIANARKEGKWTHYSLSPSGVEKSQQLLKDILQSQKIDTI